MSPVKVLVGIDIQPIEEVEEALRNFGARYGRLIYTAHELEVCGDNFQTAARLAERFAAKEAVLKVLDLREAVPPWRFIEVQTFSNSGPEIALHASAAELAQRQGIDNFSVSLSHAGGVATAAVTAEVVSQPEEPCL
jgi:holo-[acyl-carrier protein] synthase